jgi:hypothetical protein
MICYKIDRPLEALCEVDQPRPEVWRELGLGHLLPVRLTSKEWPVQKIGDRATIIGPAAQGSQWIRATPEVEICLPHGHFAPALIMRSEIIPGPITKNKAGHEWIIPNANPQSPYLSIPNEICWGLDGPRMVPDESYRPVMDLCQTLFSAVADMGRIPHLWAAEQCLRILQINYRIGNLELAALQSIGQNVIDRDFAARVVVWFVDLELLEDFVKKKQPAESTCSTTG